VLSLVIPEHANTRKVGDNTHSIFVNPGYAGKVGSATTVSMYNDYYFTSTFVRFSSLDVWTYFSDPRRAVMYTLQEKLWGTRARGYLYIQEEGILGERWSICVYWSAVRVRNNYVLRLEVLLAGCHPIMRILRTAIKIFSTMIRCV
jgi:hypothetical protein